MTSNEVMMGVTVQAGYTASTPPESVISYEDWL
jgi:hypothetical protein